MFRGLVWQTAAKEIRIYGRKIHKRRVHYSGTHPKRFEEKYKEHNPENMRIR